VSCLAAATLAAALAATLAATLAAALVAAIITAIALPPLARRSPPLLSTRGYV
jgi:hypothetical protein